MVIMIFLPVMERELRVASRRPATYYARSIAAFVAVVTTIALVYASAGGLLNVASAGRDLFVLLSCLGCVFALIEGALLTADCLSQEKRDGTLGLLFLTDLRGYDVVAEKLAARAGNAAYCLLASVPAPGLAIFLGGITGADFFRMGLALLNVLFFSASLGVLVSAVCWSERRAFGGALVLALGLGLVVPMLAVGAVHTRLATAVPPIVMFISTGAFLQALGAGPWGTLPYSFWGALGCSHLTAWGCLAAASLILPRTWREAGRASAKSRNEPPSRPAIGSSRGRWRELNPVLWLTTRGNHPALAVTLLALVALMYWAAAFVFGRFVWLDARSYVGLALLLHLALMLVTTLQASRRPAEDRRSGALELLLTTPLGERVILRGWLLGLKRQLFWPVLFVLTVDLGLTIIGAVKMGLDQLETVGWIGCALLLMGKLMADLYGLAWVGTWQGIKARSVTQAVRRAVSLVVFVRWFLLLATLAFAGLLTSGRVFQTSWGGLLALVGYVVFYAATVPHFCALAMSELREDMRSLLLGHAGVDRERMPWWPFRMPAQQRPSPADWLQKLNRFQTHGGGFPRKSA